MSLKELVTESNSQMAELKKHIYAKRKQHGYFNSTKDNLKVGKILMSINYSKNYVNKEQQKTQCTHFGQNDFSVFAACCYFRLSNGDLVNENMAVIWEASNHSTIASHTFFVKIMLLMEMQLYLEKRSPSTYGVMSVLHKMQLVVEWCYRKRHHGKGAMDSVRVVMKNRVYSDTK